MRQLVNCTSRQLPLAAMEVYEEKTGRPTFGSVDKHMSRCVYMGLAAAGLASAISFICLGVSTASTPLVGIGFSFFVVSIGIFARIIHLLDEGSDITQFCDYLEEFLSLCNEGGNTPTFAHPKLRGTVEEYRSWIQEQLALLGSQHTNAPSRGEEIAARHRFARLYFLAQKLGAVAEDTPQNAFYQVGERAKPGGRSEPQSGTAPA